MFPSFTTCFQHGSLGVQAMLSDSCENDRAFVCRVCKHMSPTKLFPSLSGLGNMHDKSFIGNSVFAAMFPSLPKV